MANFVGSLLVGRPLSDLVIEEKKRYQIAGREFEHCDDLVGFLNEEGLDIQGRIEDPTPDSILVGITVAEVSWGMIGRPNVDTKVMDDFTNTIDLTTQKFREITQKLDISIEPQLILDVTT